MKLALEAAELGRKEGLLALEAWIHKNTIGSQIEQDFVEEIIMLIVGGVFPDEIEALMTNRIIVMNQECFESHLCYLFMVVLIGVQCGEHPLTLEAKLLSCVPYCLKKRLLDVFPKHYYMPSDEEIAADAKKWDEMEKKEPWDLNIPRIKTFEIKIRGFNSRSIKRIINEFTPRELGIVLAFCEKDIRSRFSSHLSDYVKANMYNDLHYVSKWELENVLKTVLECVFKLKEAGMICEDPILWDE